MAIDLAQLPVAVRPVELGTFHNEKGIEVGDLKLSISLDYGAVDEFISRIQRATAAFKAEWEKK